MYSSGLAFEEVDQGRMENVTVSNIVMNHVHHYPIYITTGCSNRGPKEVTAASYGGNISISNVLAQDADSLAGIIVTGMPGVPLRNISLSNIRIEYADGGTADLAGCDYREQGKNYPEPKFAGGNAGLRPFCTPCRRSVCCNLFFTTSKPDHRPAVMLVDVKNHSITNLHAQTQKGVKTIVEK